MLTQLAHSLFTVLSRVAGLLFSHSRFAPRHLSIVRC
jgi:hypothetical protein